MMFNEPSFCLFVLMSPWPCPRAGQKWLMAHATHTPRFSADSARVLSSSASVAAATVTNDVVVFVVVVDVGCWLSIRMLVVVFFACSDLWSAGGCCGDGCFLILIKQFYFLVRFFFSCPKKDVVNAC